MKQNKNTLIVLLTVICLISLASFQTVGYQVSTDLDVTIHSNQTFDNYIVKLKDKPLSEYLIEFANKLDNLFAQEIKDYKSMLINSHQQTKKDIVKYILGEETYEDLFLEDYFTVFNGFSIKKVSKSSIEKIKSLSIVEDVFPDYKIYACLEDSVPLINADDVWSEKDDFNHNITGEDVTVAILDTGIDYNHVNLGGGFGPGYSVVGGYDFVNTDSDPMDDHGHGTHIAGITLGVAPNASLYAYKVLDDKGAGSVSSVLNALDNIVNPDNDSDFSDHLDVASMSFGSNFPGDPNDELNLAIDNAVNLGVVIVIAAGNIGTEGISTPGCARKAITVGSTDKSDLISSSSSRGPTIIGTIKPDVVAPGVSIRSTWIGNSYQTKSGTSMACPHVSGTAALILQKHPDWDPDEVKMSLRNSAVDIGYDITTQGYGRIDAYDAIMLEDAPVAILNTSGNFNQSTIILNGTATADNFQNYTLYYYSNNVWNKIFESDSQVADDVLYNWDMSDLMNGKRYKVKLEVQSDSELSSDMVFISKNGSSDESIFIECFNEVDEWQKFNVDIVDNNDNPVFSLVLLTAQNKIPRIKFGSTVTFRAPLILNPFASEIKAEITAIALNDQRIANKTVDVVNQKIILD
jgi:subtilisin family serine protease